MGAWVRGDRRRAIELGTVGLPAAATDTTRRLPLNILRDVALFEGRLNEATDRYEQALTAAREAGDDYQPRRCAATWRSRAYRGDRVRAAHTAAEARDHARTNASPTARAWAAYVAAEIRLDDDPEHATTLLDESVNLARSVDNRFVLGVALVSPSSLRARHGDPWEAVRLFLQVISLWRRGQLAAVRNVIELFVRLGLDRPAAVLLGAVGAMPPEDGNRLACVELGRALASAAKPGGGLRAADGQRPGGRSS